MVNLNNTIWVKLTLIGEKRLREFYDNEHWCLVQPDENHQKLFPSPRERIKMRQCGEGWYKFQLYDFMRIFGPCMSIGEPLMIEGGYISFEPRPVALVKTS